MIHGSCCVCGNDISCKDVIINTRGLLRSTTTIGDTVRNWCPGCQACNVNNGFDNLVGLRCMVCYESPFPDIATPPTPCDIVRSGGFNINPQAWEWVLDFRHDTPFYRYATARRLTSLQTCTLNRLINAAHLVRLGFGDLDNVPIEPPPPLRVCRCNKCGGGHY